MLRSLNGKSGKEAECVVSRRANDVLGGATAGLWCGEKMASFNFPSSRGKAEKEFHFLFLCL